MRTVACFLGFCLGNTSYIMLAHHEPLLILSVVPLVALLTHFVLKKPEDAK